MKKKRTLEEFCAAILADYVAGKENAYEYLKATSYGLIYKQAEGESDTDWVKRCIEYGYEDRDNCLYADYLYTESDNMKNPINPLLDHLTDMAQLFFQLNGRKPQNIEELVNDEDLSEMEREWCEAYDQFWDATSMLGNQHPATYENKPGLANEPNEKVQKIIAALIDTAKRTTDLEAIYNDETGESFLWADVCKALGILTDKHEGFFKVENLWEQCSGDGHYDVIIVNREKYATLQEAINHGCDYNWLGNKMNRDEIASGQDFARGIADLLLNNSNVIDYYVRPWK